MKEFFQRLPFNTSRIYSRVYIQDSDCFLYVPAKDEVQAKQNRDILDVYYNKRENLIA